MSSEKRNLIVSLSLIILSGCSSTRHLKPSENPEHPGTTWRMKPQGEFEHVGSARVVLKNADTIKAVSVFTREDSLLIRDDSKREISIPLMDVQKIVVKRRIKGAWQGAGLGFLAVWAVMPPLVGATVEPCEFECIGPNSFGEGFLWGLVLGPVFGVVFGVPVGATIGAIKGAEDTYIFSDSILTDSSRSDSALKK